MEKEKPYKCDVCGKRYKNLNGLKYVGLSFLDDLLQSLIVRSTSNILHPATQR
jgi:hypothetical protein